MLSSRRSLIKICAAAILGAGVGGCFQPLYGGAPGTDFAADLASIGVEPIPGRLGYYLASELSFKFLGGGHKPVEKYKLKISVRERAQTPLVDTVSGRATAAIVEIDAEYTLVALDNSRVAASGTAFTTVSYDRSSQRFANTRAARDAEIRGAETLADQIFTRVAIALKAGA